MDMSVGRVGCEKKQGRKEGSCKKKKGTFLTK